MKDSSAQSLSLMSSLLTKRDFLTLCGSGLCALCLTPVSGLTKNLYAQMVRKGLIKTKLSPYFTPSGGGSVRCDLCPKQCIIQKGKRGHCRVRENREGRLFTLVHGNPCAVHLDPIERNPLFHVLPASKSLSVATAGCNFQCKFCQNWEFSQASPEDVYSYDMSPETIVNKAKGMGARSIAYTYGEPTIFYEYMFDICHVAKKTGLLNVLHSNGFINPAPLQSLCKVLDAVNIDLKGFTNGFYDDLCNGKVKPVLETLKILKREKVHLEITNLLIPTKNDEISVVKEMCLWIKNELGADTPLHFSRFYPLHKLKKLPPTPVSKLEEARTAAMSTGLQYVYIGNVPGHEAWNTFCPECKKIVIKRVGFMIGKIDLADGQCKYCGKPIPGIWS